MTGNIFIEWSYLSLVFVLIKIIIKKIKYNFRFDAVPHVLKFPTDSPIGFVVWLSGQQVVLHIVALLDVYEFVT